MAEEILHVGVKMSQEMSQTSRVKSGTFLRWLIIFVTSFVLSFGGTIGVMAEGDVPAGILDGIMTELGEKIESVKGDARNWTKSVVTFVIMDATKPDAEPVFKHSLEPDETVYFKLKPGKYVLIALYVKDGAFDGIVEKPFRILNSTEPFGFDFRQGVPPVEA